MTVLRLERLGDGALDTAVAAVASAKLVRAAGEVFAETDEGSIGAFERSLAYCGIRATPALVDLTPPTSSRLALGRSLVAADAVALDVVEVVTLPCGAAAAAALDRRWRRWRGPSAARAARCRAVLRGEDATLAWRRRAWADLDVLRRREIRSVLRAVVFGRASDEMRYARTSATAGDLARWAFP